MRTNPPVRHCLCVRIKLHCSASWSPICRSGVLIAKSYRGCISVVIDNIVAYFMACNMLNSNNYDEINCSIHDALSMIGM